MGHTVLFFHTIQKRLILILKKIFKTIFLEHVVVDVEQVNVVVEDMLEANQLWNITKKDFLIMHQLQNGTLDNPLKFIGLLE